MQFTIYDFALSPVGNTYNVGEAEIKGRRLDFSYLMFDSFTLSGAMAYNDAETTQDFRPPDPERGTSTFKFQMEPTCPMCRRSSIR